LTLLDTKCLGIALHQNMEDRCDMNGIPLISIIVPAYNEKKRIAKMINSYMNFLDRKYDYEIIVVCDGNDDTNLLIKNIMVDKAVGQK